MLCHDRDEELGIGYAEYLIVCYLCKVKNLLSGSEVKDSGGISEVKDSRLGGGWTLRDEELCWVWGLCVLICPWYFVPGKVKNLLILQRDEELAGARRDEEPVRGLVLT